MLKLRVRFLTQLVCRARCYCFSRYRDQRHLPATFAKGWAGTGYKTRVPEDRVVPNNSSEQTVMRHETPLPLIGQSAALRELKEEIARLEGGVLRRFVALSPRVKYGLLHGNQ